MSDFPATSHKRGGRLAVSKRYRPPPHSLNLFYCSELHGHQANPDAFSDLVAEYEWLDGLEKRIVAEVPPQLRPQLLQLVAMYRAR